MRVQLAPSANVKGVDDLRVLACQVEVGDAIVLCIEAEAAGTISRALGAESVDEVADATVECLLRVVPAAVSGIAFLSGGQSGELASLRL